jgi:hypothetical protein
MASGENSQQGMLRAPVAPRTGKSLLEEMPLICFLLQGRKYPLVIVSDSFDFFVTPLLQRHNLGWIPVYTNRLRISEKKLFPAFPYGDPHYGNANCKYSLRPGRRSTALL